MIKYPSVNPFHKFIYYYNWGLKNECEFFDKKGLVVEPKLDGSNIRYDGIQFGSRNVIPLPPELEKIMMDNFNYSFLRGWLDRILKNSEMETIFFEMITPKNSIIHRRDNLRDIYVFEFAKENNFYLAGLPRTFHGRWIFRSAILYPHDWDLLLIGDFINVYSDNIRTFKRIEGLVIKLIDLENGIVLDRWKFKPLLRFIEKGFPEEFDYYEFSNDIRKFVQEFQGDIKKTKKLVQFWRKITEFPFDYYSVVYAWHFNRIERLNEWLRFLEELANTLMRGW